MHKHLKILITLFLIGMIVSGCGLLNQGTREKPDSANNDLPQAYPQSSVYVIELTPDLGYPVSPTLDYSHITPEGVVSKIMVPTPSGGNTVITGHMISSNYDGPPYVGDIFLGFLIPAEQENYPPMIKFSEEINPKGVVDVEGHFYFSDVEAGNYALIIYSLGGTYIVLDDFGDTLYIEVEAGKLYDLGAIIIP